jgi:chemotaxis protein methyltransferase CheR
MIDAECVAFLQWALVRLGLRWSGYRKVRGQVCKRITRRMRELGIPDLAAYRARLEQDRHEWIVLESLCHIPISRFWRDRGVFDRLADVILPDLAGLAAREGRPLAVWSAGCASGEEPYSLSIAFALGPAAAVGASIEILATDADEPLLERARRGVYGPGSLKDLPEAYRASAFDREDSFFCLRPAFRTPVTLRRQDIRAEMPAGPFDLVLCRNLAFTYFDRVQQRTFVPEFASRIRPGGVFVIGSHERLPAGAAGFTPEPGTPGVFRREGA